MIIERAHAEDLADVAKYDSHIPFSRLADCVNSGFVYLLKNESREVVGILRYSLFWQTIPFLDLIYIDVSCRNRGNGTLMLDHWESDMRVQGFSYVLTSTQADETAWRFYEKLGYRKVGAFLPPDQTAEEWIYLKSLTAA